MAYLSVVVPAYNSAKTIENCLRSIRRSTYSDYELIVVDDASTDATIPLSTRYADRVIEHTENLGSTFARASGSSIARGEIIVNIDSDIAIHEDTLAKIAGYCSRNGEIDAVTGMLSKEHPHTNFFSQYKNLYMHYVFKRLPENVSFLYGSIYGIRSRYAQEFISHVKIADDNALGQCLFSRGKKISFLRYLEVIHYKQYTCVSFFKNDFRIPFDWALIFLKFNGWRQLFRRKTGFLHASREQLVSILLAPLIVFALFVASIHRSNFNVFILLTSAWIICNLYFLKFLVMEKGVIFGTCALFVTFLDNITMALGAACGFASIVIPRHGKKTSR